MSALYWYDGQYVNGAKEDAAEQAYRLIGGNGSSVVSTSNGKGQGRVESWGTR